jgi:hypothetical protein
MKWKHRLFPAIIVMSIALAGCYEEEAKIVDNFWYGYNNKYNGWCVSVDGDYAAIGNPQGYNVYNFKSGSVYIAERKDGDWLANPAKLAPTDLNNDDFFGYSVGMDNDRLIVGANHRQEARIFKRYSALGNNNAWMQEKKLKGSDVAGGDYFGNAVDISGDWAIVGSPNDDNAKGSDAGAAYLFQWTGSDWVQRAKVVASDGASGDVFGSAVALDGDYAVVGEPYDNNQKGTDAGSIYVFRRNGTSWIQDAKLIASDGASSDYFGTSVAIWGVYILAGAYYDDNARGTNAGGAYFFMRNGGSYAQMNKLIADDGAASDRFGRTVALTDYFAVIGAPFNDNSAGANAGAAYVYYRSGNQLVYVEKRTASDGAAGDYFGYSAAIDGDYAVVGSLYDDNSVGGDAGSAYIFEKSD